MCATYTFCDCLHVRYFFEVLHQFYLSDGSLVIILTYLRGMYDQNLKSGQSLNYSLFSETGTLAGTLTEVHIHVCMYIYTLIHVSIMCTK